jgi:hypothetical protein
MSYYASMVQSEAMALLQADFGTRFATYRLTPMLRVLPADLPVLGVYILRERREPWGQANQGEPRFNHALTLGFSGGVGVDTDAQDQLPALEDMMSEVDDVLLSDPVFVNITDGIEAMDRVSQFAKIGETTLYEIRVEMVISFQSYWPPNITDDFNTLVVTTQFPDKAHVDAGTQQITRQYTFDQTTSRQLVRRYGYAAGRMERFLAGQAARRAAINERAARRHANDQMNVLVKNKEI